MKHRDLIKSSKLRSLGLRGMVVIMTCMSGEQMRNRFQDTKRLTKYWQEQS